MALQPLPIRSTITSQFQVLNENTINDKLQHGQLFRHFLTDFYYPSAQTFTYTANTNVPNSTGRAYDVMLVNQATPTFTNGVGVSRSFKFYMWGSIIGFGLYDIINSNSDYTNFPDATIVVDGICFSLIKHAIKLYNPPFSDAASSSLVETVAILPRLFSEGWHEVTFGVHPIPGGTNNVYKVSNIYGEKQPLNIPFARNVGSYGNTGTLTTSAVSPTVQLFNANGGSNQTPYFNQFRLWKITYYNSGASTQNVTVQWGTNTVFKQPILAGQTLDFIPSTVGLTIKNDTDAANLKHLVDGGTVTWTAFQTVE